MLCTSGFTDDVTFGRNGPDGDTWRMHVAATTASGMAIQGRRLMSYINALSHMSLTPRYCSLQSDSNAFNCIAFLQILQNASRYR